MPKRIEQRMGHAEQAKSNREWLHFADCIHAKPRTPFSGGLADLDLAVRIIRAMPPKQL